MLRCLDAGASDLMVGESVSDNYVKKITHVQCILESNVTQFY